MRKPNLARLLVRRPDGITSPFNPKSVPCHSDKRENPLRLQCRFNDTYIGMDIDFPSKSFAS